MINQIYKLFLGLLAGMTVMLGIIFSAIKKGEFATIYAPFALNINIAFQFFSAFTLILCAALAAIYQERVKNVTEMPFEQGAKVKRDYVVSVLVNNKQGSSDIFLDLHLESTGP